MSSYLIKYQLNKNSGSDYNNVHTVLLGLGAEEIKMQAMWKYKSDEDFKTVFNKFQQAFMPKDKLCIIQYKSYKIQTISND
jgi:hypothetical protein